MPDITKRLTLGRMDYFETHLSFINCVLPIKMTPMETKVLATFMAIEDNLAQYRFQKIGRKLVKDRLGLSSAGLSNHVRELLAKGHMTKDEATEELSILPILYPKGTTQDYRFRLILKSDTDVSTNQTNSVSVPQS